ncbi:hypothetical protein AQJ66_06175 [Streptomyces bungoensis]|uniref:Uncharacterized protein n=1 Tax=Streptomyces bungoensis TaxID=285568 RepID=A0A101TAX2_9ACTN|nr:hypothetical protein [Streptomyces bungoensis]KUN89043.1 hypothetical protein AQJ66_06175 [Streptomyces bungoensis]
MRLLNDLALTRNNAARREKTGTTCSGVMSRASAIEWELRLPGQPLLTVHDNHWANGERDVVLFKPTVVPEMPAALSNLHNRLRSGISATERRGELRIMVFPTYVDKHERPRVKKSLTTADLADRVGLARLRELTARKGVSLGPAFDRPNLPLVDLDDPQHEKPLQHALVFPAVDDETPVVAFTYFKIVPVLRHVDWLSPDDD